MEQLKVLEDANKNGLCGDEIEKLKEGHEKNVHRLLQLSKEIDRQWKLYGRPGTDGNIIRGGEKPLGLAGRIAM